MNKIRSFFKLKTLFFYFILCGISPLFSNEENFPKANEFTINYDNIPIIEYIQFVSKICNNNFIYKNEDLNFKVTVTSKEPITKENVMSTLIQILRIHDLYISQDENNLIISKTTNAKELFPLFNEKDTKNPIATRIFPIKNATIEALLPIIQPMTSPNAQLEIIKQERLLVATDITTNIKKIADLLENLDSQENPLVIETYDVKNNTPNSLINFTKQIMAPLISTNPYILVNQDATRTIFLVTTPALAKKTISVLKSLDTPSKGEIKTDENHRIFIYKPVNLSQIDLKKALNDIKENLKKESSNYNLEIIDTINDLKWLSETHSFVFVGTDKAIEKLKKILEGLDTPAGKEKVYPSYFLYKLNNIQGSQIEDDLDVLAKKLKSQNIEDPKLLEVIESLKWVKETNSILLTGDATAIEEVKKIIEQYDSPKKGQFFIYKPKYVSLENVENYTDDIIKNLERSDFSDPDLLESLKTLKTIPTNNAVIFTGSEKSLEKIKNLIQSYDQEQEDPALQGNFFMYYPKYVSIDSIEEYLNQIAKNLENSGLLDSNLLSSINSMKKISLTHSILFTGNTKSLDHIKNLLNTYDVSKGGQIKGNFLMYNPKNISLDDIERIMKEIAENLQKSGLIDKPLLESINGMKTVSSTNSVIFTGEGPTLDKIQALLNNVDVPLSTVIQAIGKTNFWIYKIQNARPQRILSSIKSVAQDLEKLDSSDPNFINALKSVKYIKDTNSLIFSGTSSALEKIEPLVKKFDIVSDKEEIITTYFIYKPTHLTGPELEKILQNFVENLKTTNVENPYLFEAIDSMKWTEQTKTLVFSGEVHALEEIKKLLLTFDIPDQDFAKMPSVSTLEDLGFMVYKLEFHKGNEIQEALRQIGNEIKASNGTEIQNNLIKSIESLQWIQMTNSLLCSGDPETLTKLKELIASLDVPLKQVFIEVLVIQTTLTNALSFGLDWGSKFQYKEKGVMGMSNFAPGTSTTPNAFETTFNKITNTRTPVGTDLSLGDGFDLGIIGDILFHKGRSFLSLGSLLQALQSDTETSIVMTPKIIAQDGKTANIFSGQNIPYSGSVIQNQGNNSLVTTNLEYRDVGMYLTITPILGNSNSVTLSINLESSATPATTSGEIQLGQVSGITTTKTNMNTSVLVSNKNFLVLSGMVTDTKVRAKSGIPCLGGLPWIGAAFSKNTTQQARNNIVIFLRPHIINSYKDMQNLTQSQEDGYREQTGTPSLERDFDEATEFIKSFDND